MTVDANGNIHDDTNGRFAGHLQGEGDTAVLDQPAAAKSVAQRIFDEVSARHEAARIAVQTAPSNADYTYREARAHGVLDALTTIQKHLGEPDLIDVELRDELAAWQARRDWLNDRQEETGGDELLADKWDDSDHDAIALVQSFIEKLGITAAPIDFCRSCGDPRGSNRMTCDGCLIADEPDDAAVTRADEIDPTTCEHRDHEPIGGDRHQCTRCGATWLLSAVVTRPITPPGVDYGFVVRQARANWHGGA